MRGESSEQMDPRTAVDQAVRSLIMHPRSLVSHGRPQINPEASRDLTSDTEIDARFDRVYHPSCPAFRLGRHVRSIPDGYLGPP